MGWSVRPQKNHLIWAIVLPIRELFMYIESATNLSSREEREARNIHTKRTGNSYGRAGQERDLGWVAAVRIYGQALQIQIGFTDVYRLVHSIWVFSWFVCVPTACVVSYACTLVLLYRLDDRALWRHIHPIPLQYLYTYRLIANNYWILYIYKYNKDKGVFLVQCLVV